MKSDINYFNILLNLCTSLFCVPRVEIIKPNNLDSIDILNTKKQYNSPKGTILVHIFYLCIQNRNQRDKKNLRPCVLVKKWAFEKYSKSRHSRTMKSVQDLICSLALLTKAKNNIDLKVRSLSNQYFIACIFFDSVFFQLNSIMNRFNFHIANRNH